MRDINEKKKNTFEENIRSLNKELEVQNKKLTNVYSFFEDGTYSREVFAERCVAINEAIANIKANLEEAERQMVLETKQEESKKAMVSKIENVLDLYEKLENAEEKNLLLKTVVNKIVYLKTEKAIKKDSDPTKFELDIYPNI